MAAKPQPTPKLTIKDVARMAGFMVSTIRKWQRDGKVPPAPTDGKYSLEYVEILQTYRKNALSAQSKNRWANLTPEERTEVAKKQWTPERKKTQSITMRNVRLGLTGLTPEKLEEWNTNSRNAADTQKVRDDKARGAKDLWARRTAALVAAQAEVTAKQADLDAAKARLAVAERRELLKGKALWMRVAGDYLIENPSAEGSEVVDHLDKTHVPRRDGKLWVAVKNKPSFKNDLSELRGLLGIQRRKFGREL